MIAYPRLTGRAARQEPRARRAHSRLALEATIVHSKACLAAIDDEGQILAMSEPALALLGYRSDHACGQPAASLLPLLNTTRLAQVGRARRALGVRADGSLVHLLIDVIRVAVTDYDGWIVVMEREASH